MEFEAIYQAYFKSVSRAFSLSSGGVLTWTT